LPNIQVLTLPFSLFGHSTTLNPVLLYDGDEALLVDCGLPGQCSVLCDALLSCLKNRRLTKVVITCQDIDHFGCAMQLGSLFGAQLICHHNDLPYIEGRVTPLKLDPLWMRTRVEPFRQEALRVASDISGYSEQVNKFGNDIRLAGSILEALPKVRVDNVLYGGEVMQVLGGIDVLWAPGPTPGHIVLYVRSMRLLIAGDLVRVEEGVLRYPNSTYVWDQAQTVASLRMVARLDVDYVAAYHGGLYGPDAAVRLKGLLVDMDNS